MNKKEITLKNCKEIIKKLLENENSWPFMEPIEPERFGLEDYFKIIKKPMDLGTIKRKLETGKYDKPSEVLEDIQLIWDNVYLYYKKNTTMYDYAKKLEDETKQRIQNIEEGIPLKITPRKKKKESDFCGVCNKGGNLLICDGGCLQAFHFRCVGLSGAPKTSTWYCDKCKEIFRTRIPKSTKLTTLSNSTIVTTTTITNNPTIKIDFNNIMKSTSNIVKLLPGYNNVPSSIPTSTFIQKRLMIPDEPTEGPWSSEILEQQKLFEEKTLQHLWNSMTLEQKIKRRKIEEEEIQKDKMYFDPYWCIWRPKSKVELIANLEKSIVYQERE
jgi:hypothetical protein